MTMKQSGRAAMVAAAGAMIISCGSDTGRSRVDFEVSVVSQPLSDRPNEFGYVVQLSRAELSLARLAFFEGEPLFTRIWPRTISDFLIAPAYAHPGHYAPGESLGDILVERQFDLLNEAPMVWGSGVGVTGNYASAELDLNGGTSAAVILEGTATGPVGTVPFVAALNGFQEIIGLTAGFVVGDKPFDIVVHVDVNAIVERIDFGRVAPADEIATAQEPIRLVRDTQPYNAFSRASIGNGTYRFEMKEME